MQIVAFTAGMEDDWQRFLATREDATFFHESAWRRVLADVFGFHDHYLVALQDGAICGVMPLMGVKSALFGHRLISTPFCVYGGMLACDQTVADALIAAAIQRFEKSGASSLELRLRNDGASDNPAMKDWPTRDDLYATFRKSITGDDAANMQAIPRKQRAALRKGLGRGLKHHVSQDVDGLHRVYSESVRNLGTPVFPRKYFRALLHHFPHNVEVISISDKELVHSAVLNFNWRDETLPYYGGGIPAARESQANDVMYWQVMSLAAARGARIFDFGRSKLHTGAYNFKKNWGFDPQPIIQRFVLRPGCSIPDHNPLNPKYRRIVNAWKRLPLPVANLIGPFIVRGTG